MDRLERLLAEGKVHAINPVLASRLQREDLSGFNPSPVVDPYSNPAIAVGQITAKFAQMDSGRLAAGIVGLLVIATAGFYLWTRKFQS